MCIRDRLCRCYFKCVNYVVDYFTCNVSTVYAASLDISKALDRVLHCELFIRLIKAGLPKCIIDVLVNWYSKLTSAVKWNTCM